MARLSMYDRAVLAGEATTRRQRREDVARLVRETMGDRPDLAAAVQKRMPNEMTRATPDLVLAAVDRVALETNRDNGRELRLIDNDDLTAFVRDVARLPPQALTRALFRKPTYAVAMLGAVAYLHGRGTGAHALPPQLARSLDGLRKRLLLAARRTREMSWRLADFARSALPQPPSQSLVFGYAAAGIPMPNRTRRPQAVNGPEARARQSHLQQRHGDDQTD